MSEPIAALVVRILTDTADMVSGVKKASDQLDGFENHVVDTDKALREISAASGHAAQGTGELTSTYRQFDGVLQAVGINIGPQIKGLEDIAAAAGKSAGSVGLLSTAGLALGAGVGAWGIARAAMEFFDLDKNVEANWRTLLGYKSAVEQTAAAQNDTINRAIAMGADEHIRYKDAIEFVIQAQKRDIDAKIDWRQKLADAHAELRGLTETQKEEIQIARDAGATTEQLTNKFRLSAQALSILAQQHREAASAAEEHRKKAEQLTVAYDKLMSDIKNAKGMALFEDDAAKQRRAEANQRGLDLMDRDAGLFENRRLFDEGEQRERDRIAYERGLAEEQAALDADNAARFQALYMAPSRTTQTSPLGSNVPGFASVMYPAPNITINANNSLYNNPAQLNELARLVEDALSKRSGLTSAYTRR